MNGIFGGYSFSNFGNQQQQHHWTRSLSFYGGGNHHQQQHHDGGWPSHQEQHRQQQFGYWAYNGRHDLSAADEGNSSGHLGNQFDYHHHEKQQQQHWTSESVAPLGVGHNSRNNTSVWDSNREKQDFSSYSFSVDQHQQQHSPNRSSAISRFNHLLKICHAFKYFNMFMFFLVV